MIATRWSLAILLASLAGCSPHIDPSFDWGPLSCHPKDEGIAVEPWRAVVAVGATVEFSVSPGSQKYTWRRCPPSGLCTDMPDVTGPSYTWAGLNLADDGSRIEVTSYDCAVTGHGSVVVEVLPGPGWTFEDVEFLAGDWEIQVFDEAGGPTQVASSRPTAGGNPGAYLAMSYDVPPQSSSHVFHGALRATYDPAAQGAIHAVNMSAQSPPFDPLTPYLRDLRPAFRQGGRWYSAYWGRLVSSLDPPAQWAPAFSATGWDEWLFEQFAGPPCGAGERCPDFSTQGSPITFGFMVTVYSLESGAQLRVAVDNWKVTVWRR